MNCDNNSIQLQMKIVNDYNQHFLIYADKRNIETVKAALITFYDTYNLDIGKNPFDLICELSHISDFQDWKNKNYMLAIIADNDRGTAAAKENQLKQNKINYCFYSGGWNNETFLHILFNPSDFQVICENISDYNYIEHFEEVLQAELNRKRITTGFKQLDRFLHGGFDNGQLYVLAGDPAAGKTAFCQNIALETMRAGNDVLYFSLEMSRKELTARALCYLSKLDQKISFTFKDIFARNKTDILTTRIKDCIGEYKKIAAGKLKIIESVFDFDVNSIRQAVYAYTHNTGRQPLIIIDYFQLLQPINDYQTDKQNADYNIKELKKIARDFDIPILCISSLNRSNYSDKEKSKLNISMAGLKESGSIEYTASVIIFLNNLDGINNNSEYRSIALTIPKNRNGVTVLNDEMKFYFYAKNYCFSEYAF